MIELTDKTVRKIHDLLTAVAKHSDSGLIRDFCREVLEDIDDELNLKGEHYESDC